MFVGTGSDVGKSVINAAFCRIFKQDGYNPAPFKAQNMSLNSYPTKDGLEIGRAQAAQAGACGIECSVDMNPILLKPNNNITAQLVLNGRAVANKSAAEYFDKSTHGNLFKYATEAFDRLNSLHNPIVMEGAGSISEVNLWDRDIVNMRMALYADAAVYLIADIDRGGVFGSLYGTIMLLPPEQRNSIKGIIINKFRGDINLFEQGRKMVEELTGIPLVAVVPYLDDIFIEQEDSLSHQRHTSENNQRRVVVAVVLLKHLSNFTDFNMLERHPAVQLIYACTAADLADADIVIIPGSKNTISDMGYLRRSGLAKAILEHHAQGKPLYGICGGFQMMGEMIYDPHHIEGETEAMPALSILPISTTLLPEKTTRQCTFHTTEFDASGNGYEIHVGVTASHRPFAILDNGQKDGFYLNAKCWGTYIHGVFDNPSVVASILNQISADVPCAPDYETIKEQGYDRLADWVRQCTDMEYIYRTMKYD